MTWLLGPLVLAADAPSGEATGWTVLGLLVTGLLGLAGEYLRRQRKDSPTSPPIPPEVQAPVPATPEGKLDAAQELFRVLKADRDETKAELEALRTRHADELERMRQTHARELSQVQARMQGQDAYIARLERLLGMAPTPPQGSPPGGLPPDRPMGQQ